MLPIRALQMRGGGGPAYNAETLTWISRITALGGSVTDSEKLIADNLITAIQGASYGSKIIYLLPFLGNNIAAHRVPLRDTLAVGAAFNGTFVDADCSTAGGLANPTEAGKYLDSLVLPSQLGSSNNGGLGWIELNWGNGVYVEPMGTYGSNNSPDQRFVIDLRSTLTAFRWGLASNGASITASASNGHYYGQRNSSTLRKMFKNGSPLSPTNTTSDTASRANERTIYVHGCRTANATINISRPWKGSSGGAYFTDGTLSDADVAAFHTLLTTYLSTPAGR